MNKVFIMGHLGQDPEERTGGVVTFSVATNDRRKNKDSGEYEDHTTWHNVVSFQKTAETIKNYVKKGTQVLIEGKLNVRKYVDKDGNDRVSTDIICDRFEFAGPKPEKGTPEGYSNDSY